MNAGILVIGSLIWDPHPEREAWRRSRLLVDQALAVEAPIRYGRCSVVRGNTFAMTIDPATAGGQGLLVPCRHPVTSGADLIGEALHLWHAEFPAPEHRAVRSSWACVGALFREPALGVDIAPAWGHQFRHAWSPYPPVDEEGMLGILWPARAGKVDVLLAVAARAVRVRPTPEEVADAWVDQAEGHEGYFFQNVLHRIRTSEDQRIWKRMQQRAPSWLEKAEHGEAVALLRGEAPAATVLPSADRPG